MQLEYMNNAVTHLHN